MLAFVFEVQQRQPEVKWEYIGKEAISEEAF